MSEPETPYFRLPPEALGTEPAGFDSQTLRPARWVEAERDGLLATVAALTARAERAEESVLRLKVELAEQEVDKLDLIVERVNQRAELTRLKDAIRTASSTKTAGKEIVACAQSATGVDVFRAGQTIGRASLAQDLLNLFDL